MINAQSFVLASVEYAAAGAVLLLATKLIVSRLWQPIDRQNLILIGLVTSACLPLVVGFTANFSAWPRWHLGFVKSPQEPGDAASISSLRSSSSPWSLLMQSDSSVGDWQQQPAVPLRSLERPDREQPGIRAAASATANSAAIPIPVLPVDRLPADHLAADHLAEETSADTQVGWWLAAAILLASQVLAMGYFAIEWIIGKIRLRDLCRSARPADASVKETWKQVANEPGASVRLLVSPQITAPLVFGCWRPVVLIPASLAEGDRTALRFCLAHEWSHVLGGDLRAWQFTNLCQCWLWYQPLFWMLRRELRICQDLVADDRAAGVSGNVEDRLQYSELLLSIARQRLNPKLAGAIAFHDRSSHLARRIKMLLRSRPAFRLASTYPFFYGSCGLMLVSALLIGSVRLNAARAERGIGEQPTTTSLGDTLFSAGEIDSSQPTEDVRIVQGRVTDEHGQPIVGVQLWLPLEVDTTHIVSGRTDQEGRFVLRCPLEWIRPNAWRRLSYLWASAPGYDLQVSNVFKALRDDTDEDFHFILLPESQVRYRLLRPNGDPCVGLEVASSIFRDGYQSYSIPQELRGTVSGITDAEGWVTLRGVPQEKIDTVEMQSDEFGRQRQRLSMQAPFRLDSIRMRPTAAIQGRIIGENPAWVSGLRLQVETTVNEEWQDTTGHAEVITDTDGRFEIPQIAVGKSTRLYVHPDPSLPVRLQLPDDVILTEGETALVEIPWVPAPLVTGTVLSKNQTPIANAGITLFYGSGSRQMDRIVTDEHGRYEGRVVPGEFSVHLFSIPPGHARPAGSRLSHSVSAETESFEVPPIELLGTAKIAGRLIDEHDQPLAGKWIDAVNSNTRHGVGLSDAQGNFEITVPDGMETIVQLSTKEQGFGETLIVVQRVPLILRYVENKQNDLYDAKREAKADVTLSGRIIQAGNPVADVRVILNVHLPTLQLDGTQHPNLGRFGPKVEVTTDAEGRYRLEGLKAGDRCSINIRPNFAAVDLDWPHYGQTIPENAEEVLELTDVNLQPLTQSIAGIVVDPDGNPVKGAKVSAQQRGGQSIRFNRSRPQSSSSTISDEQGRFQINELPEIPLSIYAYLDHPKAGYIRFPVKFEIERNQQDIRILLDPSLIED